MPVVPLHFENPAYNLCSQPQIPASFDVNCSLVCYLGRPFQSGFVYLYFYRKDCGSLAPAPTFLYNPDFVNTNLNCDPNFNPNTPLNNRWVGTGGITTNQGIGYGYTIRADTNLVFTRVPASGAYGVRDFVSMTASIYRLMPDVTPYWANCASINLTLGEIVGEHSNDPYETKIYESDLTQISFDVPSCTGDVDFIKAVVILFPYRFGCSLYDTEGSSKCALYSDRGGYKRSYTCLMALITPAARNSWLPQFVQLGYNSVNCGTGTNPPCGCLEWNGATLTPAQYPFSRYTQIGCPNELPDTNTQQIQYGAGGINTAGNQYEIIIKSINRQGSLCVAARVKNSFTSYVIGTIVILQDTDPFIAKIDFTGLLPDNPIIYLYGYEFPSAEIKNCFEDHQNTGVLPFNLFDNDSGTFGIRTEPNTFNVLGYNNVSIGNIIGYDASLMMGVVDVYHPEVQQQLIEQPTHNHFSSNNILTNYKTRAKNKCIHFHEEVIENDSTCGCAGAKIYKCDKFGKCKFISNKLNEELPQCIKCDEYVGRINLL